MVKRTSPTLDRRGIPAKVLRGEVRKYRSVGTTYKAVFLQALMESIHEAFMVKSTGGTDELGNKWKPLAPSTKIYKPITPIERADYKIGTRARLGLLTMSQHARWSSIVGSKVRRFMKQGYSEEEALRMAAQVAWGILKRDGARTKLADFDDRDPPINIRTGTLANALRAGTVTNNRYYTPQYQVVTFTSRSVSVSIDLDYFDKVQEARPAIPANVVPWIVRAHDIAIQQAVLIYENLKVQYGDSKTNKNSDRNRRN